MKQILTLSFIISTFLVSFGQTTSNFFLNNVNSVVHNYSTDYIANNASDKTVKYSIVVSATGGNITATFILYFGANVKDAEIDTVSTNVYTVRSWHKLDEYDNLSNLLKVKEHIGIGFYNNIGSFPKRVQISKSSN